MKKVKWNAKAIIITVATTILMMVALFACGNEAANDSGNNAAFNVIDWNNGFIPIEVIYG